MQVLCVIHEDLSSVLVCPFGTGILACASNLGVRDTVSYW